ncbi:hypothetical protein G7077_11455 [Sphingomonas piscis]|uniref:Uncharacterized protein n=1 Tax=Sphingomonas piscis TaxID=2714943 RepID=A0A6G7YRQ5_9SPHN|nr:hypothetical protein [Sphingomonas piscis]QIK79428.1 hypothetical protein G7077_11455 [Sphingomonas piscis]
MPDPEGAKRPVLLDIDIQHDQAFFWRGQLDARGDSIKLRSGWETPDDCEIIIGSGHPESLPLELNSPSELRIRINPYLHRSPDPARFNLAFNYEASAKGIGPAGPSCDEAARRTVEMNFEFEILPGQTITLPDYVGYRIRLTRP